MFVNTPSRFLAAPVLRYVGDIETGIVHCIDQSCDILVSEAFLDLRTAMIRGYRLCPLCCKRMVKP